MFDSLSEKIESAILNLKGRGRISEINVAETTKEIRKALLDADVNYKVAKKFTDDVKQIALGQGVIKSISPGQVLTKITRDELAKLMGSASVDINLNDKPSIILMSGLQGSGKTTFSGKLAQFIKSKKGRKPLLIACDVYRPAAIDQLHVVGASINVDVYSDKDEKNPVKIALDGIAHAKTIGANVIIIDTAGRLAVDTVMMDEIKAVKAAVNPSETLFVVDAMTGQDAVNTAKAFNDTLNFDGVVLTKMDGDTRGGAAISIRTVVDKPIKFIGNGEKMDAIDIFHPDRMADRILGMGDVVSLVEKAQEQFDAEKAKKLQKKISKNKFDFNDFLDQIKQIQKMGNVKDLMGMIPGVGKMAKNMDIDDNAFTGVEAIIYSMTPGERSKPELLDSSRRKRIASGSGKDIQEVNRLIKQFDETKKMMKLMSNKKNMMSLMSQMKGANKGPF